MIMLPRRQWLRRLIKALVRYLVNMDHIEHAILTTLLYSDIFNFPLTKDELWQLLISKRKIERSSFEKALQCHCEERTHLSYQDGYYCLSGRERIIRNRIENLPQVQKKLQIAKRAAFHLSYIPTIYFIGISGGLA